MQRGESVYFEVLTLSPRGSMAAWPQIKFMSTYPHNSMAAWPQMIYFIIYIYDVIDIKKRPSLAF